MGSSPNRLGHRRWQDGNRYVRQGRYPEAVVAFSDAIRLNAGEADFYHNRAVARAADRDVDGARQDLWRAIELDPGSDDSRTLEAALPRGVRDLPASGETSNTVPAPEPSRTPEWESPPLDRLLECLRSD